MNIADLASAGCPEQLSNDDLLTSTRRLVGCANRVLAALLAHLAEVEARGLHRERRCASLYTYCIYELRMSEDAAYRRAKAARLVRKFPALLGAIGSGELHLTGLLLLGPHLTDENHVEVLALAKHRTKKEIARLVRRLDPLPDVPAQIEPLGPAPARLLGAANPPWRDLVRALAGPVRELAPGERPSDSCSDALAPSTTPPTPAPAAAPTPAPPPLPMHSSSAAAERYKVQFTATQEYVDLLEEARDLLSHAVPSGAIDEVHLRAMRLLVKELRKRKYATTDRPREQPPEPLAPEPEPGTPRRRGRTIPAEVRRRVSQRDGESCTYVDAAGRRCQETRLLEFHHEDAYARGGPPTEANLTLRCRAHNALAAEQDFGRDFMANKKGVELDARPCGP